MKKCPYCAEEIQDEATVCRYCGRDLTVPVGSSGQGVPATPLNQATSVEKPKKKRKSGCLIVGGVVLAVIILSIVLASNTNNVSDAKNPTASVGFTATFAPTGTPIYWDSSRTYPQPVSGLYEQILANQKNMTDIQFKNYAASIVGQRIHMIGTVREVKTDNQVYLAASDGGFFDSVYLSGLPKEILLTLNKDQVIEFDATITSFTDIIITVLDLNDPVVYSIK